MSWCKARIVTGSEGEKMRRALVSLPDGVWKIIDKELKGKIGDGDSEVIRHIVVTHLTEKGYLLKPKGTQIQTEEIASEIDIHDSMIEALVDILEEKGHVKAEEWERRTQQKLHMATKE
jgi:metal-responsive CopG/Arc/MetJ family transcriptional regulator